jgi:hypothetical protein
MHHMVEMHHLNRSMQVERSQSPVLGHSEDKAKGGSIGSLPSLFPISAPVIDSPASINHGPVSYLGPDIIHQSVYIVQRDRATKGAMVLLSGFWLSMVSGQCSL